MTRPAFDVRELHSPAEAHHYIGALARLLKQSVDGGATVGFLAPLSIAAAERYWKEFSARLPATARLVVALDERGDPLGTGQLLFPWQPNGRHRAEISKLLVDERARRRGIGLAIIRALEAVAAADGRSLVLLNTRSGEPPESVYRRAGYRLIGEIPDYTRNADGEFHPTVMMYRLLDRAR